jgi:hypothetical protein
MDATDADATGTTGARELFGYIGDSARFKEGSNTKTIAYTFDITASGDWYVGYSGAKLDNDQVAAKLEGRAAEVGGLYNNSDGVTSPYEATDSAIFMKSR